MVYIIAEAGVNHNGSLETAYQLIDVAKKSGANAIKFQTFKSEKVISEKAEKAEYQKETTGNDESQLDMVKKLELSYDSFKKIYKRCQEVGIKFISTPFDLDSVDFLNELGVDIFKVGSGDVTNYMMLKRIAHTGKKIILSTGMSTMEEVKNSVNFLYKEGCKELVVLHCVSCYPTQPEDLNLKCITSLQQELNIPIGFSDHTTGNEASIYSVCLGAEYIEKHFTLDKNSEGPDHRASLNSEELINFVSKIRECEIMMGSGIKICQEREKEVRQIARRSLFVTRDLVAGHILSEDDLIPLRPYDGICVSKFEEYIGKQITTALSKNDYLIF
jgi:N,N'-diacetyllegionaminate synthase